MLTSLVFGLFLCALSSAAAQDADEKPLKIKIETVQGEITGRTRLNLSVEYKLESGTAYEMVLPIDSNTQIQGLKNVNELQRGDRISAVYEVSYQEDAEGNDVPVKTMAKEIKLIRSSMGNDKMSSLSVLSSKEEL